MPYTRYHPVFLNLNGRRVLIVGGGAIAMEKLASLLPESGAAITVLSPEVTPEIQAWHASGQLNWQAGTFSEAAIHGFFMVIAATDDPAINALIYRVGDAAGKLTNSVDDPDHCNFIMAAIAKDGPMQAAISSAGCSPALAQRLRNRIAEELLPPGTGAWAEYLGDWRPRIKSELPTYRHRQGFWERVIASDIEERFATDRAAADRAMEAGLVWGQARPACLACGVKGYGFVTVCTDCPHAESGVEWSPS